MKKYFSRIDNINGIVRVLILPVGLVFLLIFGLWLDLADNTANRLSVYQLNDVSVNILYPTTILRETVNTKQPIRIWMEGAPGLSSENQRIFVRLRSNMPELIFTDNSGLSIEPEFVFDLDAPRAATTATLFLELLTPTANLPKSANILLDLNLPEINQNIIVQVKIESQFQAFIRKSWESSKILIILVAILLLSLPQIYYQTSTKRNETIKELEKQLQDAITNAASSPGKIKPIWDLARFTLESYFGRNLSQISLIFWLSVFVMIVGFGIIVWGISLALQSNESIYTATITGAAGIITEFIGATFLLVYKSTIQQANDYLKTLERINSVGMAMQILDTMPENSSNDDLKNKTKAEIAGLLVQRNPDVDQK